MKFVNVLYSSNVKIICASNNFDYSASGSQKWRLLQCPYYNRYRNILYNNMQTLLQAREYMNPDFNLYNWVAGIVSPLSRNTDYLVM